jgi:hypothetical protein
MDTKETIKISLEALLAEFGRMDRNGTVKGASEASARTWVERFLTIFGWDPANPHQVRQ